MTKARDNATQGGLVLINTTSFTTASTITVDNIFNSTYDSYKLILQGVQTSNGSETRIRLRTGGVDNSNSSYQNTSIRIGTTGTYNIASGTTYFVVNNNNVDSNFVVFDIINPNKALSTFIGGHMAGVDPSNAWNAGGAIAAKFAAFTVFDGLSIFFSAGTMTGTLKIYGYKN